MQEYYQRAALEHLSLEYITKSNSNNFLYKDKKLLARSALEYITKINSKIFPVQKTRATVDCFQALYKIPYQALL